MDYVELSKPKKSVRSRELALNMVLGIIRWLPLLLPAVPADALPGLAPNDPVVLQIHRGLTHPGLAHLEQREKIPLDPVGGE